MFFFTPPFHCIRAHMHTFVYMQMADELRLFDQEFHISSPQNFEEIADSETREYVIKCLKESWRQMRQPLHSLGIALKAEVTSKMQPSERGLVHGRATLQTDSIGCGSPLINEIFAHQLQGLSRDFERSLARVRKKANAGGSSSLRHTVALYRKLINEVRYCLHCM